MADKYINATGVATIRDWANGKFALDSEFDTLAAEVQALVAEGGQPNVIENITVNGSPVQPNAQKTVALSIPVAVSELANDSNFKNQTEVNTAISNALLNSGDPYQTASEVDSMIDSKISSVYKPQGAITFSQLPALSAAIEGYVYNITNSFTTTVNFIEGAGHSHSAGTNIVCVQHNGSYMWDCLHGTVDLSAYWTSASGEANTLEAMTIAEINAILAPSS